MKQNILITETQLKKLVEQSIITYKDYKNMTNDPKNYNIDDIKIFKVYDQSQINEIEDFLKYKFKKSPVYEFPLVIISIDIHLATYIPNNTYDSEIKKYSVNDDDKMELQKITVYIPFLFNTRKQEFYSTVYLPTRFTKNTLNASQKKQLLNVFIDSPGHIAARLKRLLDLPDDKTYLVNQKLRSLLEPHKPKDTYYETPKRINKGKFE